MRKLIILSLLISACSSNGLKQVGLESWNGEWISEEGEDSFLETWKSIDANEMAGYGAMLHSGDTIFSERIQLIKEKEDIYYVVTIKENSNLPVRFKLTSSSANQWIFENSEHDFPTRITYELTAENKLRATIEGSEQTADQNFTLYFKRK